MDTEMSKKFKVFNLSDVCDVPYCFREQLMCVAISPPKQTSKQSS